MAITTQDGLIAAIAAGRTVQFNKGSITTVAGGAFSLWRAAGMPGAGANPAATPGNTLDRTSTGAMPIPAPSALSYISSFEGVASQAGTLVIADRLVEVGGLSGTVTTAQTVNSAALPTRATGATDVELWVDLVAAIGATASPTVTASYTNQAGTSGRTATLIGGFPSSGGTINRTYQMSLQAGDTGVQSVQTFTSTTSTTGAGNIAIVLRRSLLFGFAPAANVGWSLGYAETDLQSLPDNAALELLYLATTTSSGNILGNFGVAQG